PSMDNDSWITLFTTVKAFLNHPDANDETIKVVPIKRFFSYLSFYNHAYNYLINIFTQYSSDMLTDELKLIRLYYLNNNPCPLDFILYSKAMINDSGMRWNKSTSVNQLYDVILFIQFDNQCDANTISLKNLQAAISQYQDSILKISNNKNRMFDSNS